MGMLRRRRARQLEPRPKLEVIGREEMVQRVRGLQPGQISAGRVCVQARGKLSTAVKMHRATI